MAQENDEEIIELTEVVEEPPSGSDEEEEPETLDSFDADDFFDSLGDGDLSSDDAREETASSKSVDFTEESLDDIFASLGEESPVGEAEKPDALEGGEEASEPPAAQDDVADRIELEGVALEDAPLPVEEPADTEAGAEASDEFDALEDFKLDVPILEETGEEKATFESMAEKLDSEPSTPESGEPVVAAPEAVRPETGISLDPAQVQRILAEEARGVLAEVARKVFSEVAEKVLKEEISRIRMEISRLVDQD